jgi:predicted RNase H-like nuclease (RuvC/YqgF family)
LNDYRNTIITCVWFQRLSKELEESQRQNQTLIKTSREQKIPAYPSEKHLEDRLKLSSNECSRLSHELKTARKTNEELSEKLKLLQEK